MALGSLIVEVAANVARFQSDMGKMAQIAETQAKRMDAVFGVVKTSLAAMGAAAAAGFTISKFKDSINSSIEFAASLQQLSERTGGTVEQLSGLASIAKLSGTSTDDLATGLQKLSKSMVDAETGGVKTTAAFKSIGIGVDQLKSVKPDELFQKVALQLDKYRDGAEKTALAQALFGKAGANLLPVMKDLAEAGDLQVKVTAEQAEMADRYEKNLVRLQMAQNAVYKTISMQTLPVMNAFAQAMLDNITGANGLKKSIDDLAADNAIRDWAESGARAIAFVIDGFTGVVRWVQATGTAIGAAGAAIGQVLQGNFAAAKQIMSESDKDIAAIYDKPIFSERLDARLREMHDKAGKGAGAAKPKLAITPESQNAADTLRAELDQRLKALDNFIAQEAQKLKAREAVLQRLYGDDQLSIASYFAQRRQAEEAALSATSDAYNKQIAALEAYINAVGAKTKDGIQAQTRIADVRQKLQQATAQAAEQAAQRDHEQAKAVRDYADSIARLQIEMLNLAGSTAQAAAMQQQLSDRQLRQRIDVEGDSRAKALLDQVEAMKAYQAQASEIQQHASLLDQKLGTASGRNQLDANRGSIGMMEQLRRTGADRQKAADDMRQLADQYDRVAQSSGDPKLIADAEAFRLKLDELAASANVLADTFNNTFTDAFSNAFGEFLNGTKSASAAFKDFTNSVVQSINKMVAESLSKQLFGDLMGGSSGGGIGGIFASIFGGAGGGSGGSGGLYAGIGALFGGARADGGAISPGRFYQVNERGPELLQAAGKTYLMGAGSGQVQPASGGQTINVSVAMPQGGDRRTATQFGAAAARQIQLALARNG